MEQDAIIADMMRRLDAQGAAIASLVQPAPLCPPGCEDYVAPMQSRTRVYEDANSSEGVGETEAEDHGGGDAAEFYKEQWRQNKVETSKQKKEIAGLQAMLKTFMNLEKEKDSEAAGQGSSWDWSYTDHGWHNSAPWQWAGQASSQNWDWSQSVDSIPAHVPAAADEVRTGSAEEDQAGTRRSWPDPLTAKDPWKAYGCKEWSWGGANWYASSNKDWSWSPQSHD